MLKKKYKKKFIEKTVALLVPILFLFSGCSSTSQNTASKSNNKEIIYGIQTEPNSLDPYKASTADGRKILFNVFEGLVKVDKDGSFKNAVSESHTVSDDGTTYSFKIRKNVKFHNGKKVTAEDVKYSLDTAISNKVKGFDIVKNVNVKDENVVEINLKRADANFIAYLTTAIVPKDYNNQAKKPVGTGPYKFKSFTPQESLVLEKNNDYWQSNGAKLQKVTFKLESDTNALLLDLQSGSVDAASVDNSTVSQLDKSQFNIYEEHSNAVQQLNLNNKFKPFDNVKVRQAVSYAVDKKEIIKTVNSGKGTAVGTPIIPGLKKYYDDSLTYKYKKDVSKAKSLLKEAGYENGFSFTITVPSNYKVHVDTAQVIVSQLKNIGINAAIKQVDWPTWLSNVYTNKNYEATIVSFDSSVLAPNGFLGRYVTGASNNFLNYSNEKFDSVYQKATIELDEKNRVKLYKDAQKILAEDAASVYIQDISDITVMKKQYSGFTSYPMYVFDAAAIK